MIIIKLYTKSELYNMSMDKIDNIWKYLYDNIDKIDCYKNIEFNLYNNLMAVFGLCPEYIQKKAIDKRIFTVKNIYYKAPEYIGKYLSDFVLSNEYDIHTILPCLSMQAGEHALNTFLELNGRNDDWKKNLSEYYFADIINMYANIGGWDFDFKGNKYDLIYNKCLSIDLNSDVDDDILTIFTVRDDKCIMCGCSMVNLVSINCDDNRLSFLGLRGIVTISCCVYCVCEYTFYSKYDYDGTSIPIFDNDLIEYSEYQNNFESDIKYIENYFRNNSIAIKDKNMSVFYAYEEWYESTIGGFPHWVDDENYTKCPKCKNTMKYLMQLNHDEIVCGTLYICICDNCKIGSVSYQQT